MGNITFRCRCTLTRYSFPKVYPQLFTVHHSAPWSSCFPSPAANSCPHFGAVKPLGSVPGPAGEPLQHLCPPKPHDTPQLSCSAHGLALSFHPQALLPLSRNTRPWQATLFLQPSALHHPAANCLSLLDVTTYHLRNTYLRLLLLQL